MSRPTETCSYRARILENRKEIFLLLLAMEPLSTAASVIAVVGAASKSCKHLLIFFRGQINRASDLRHYMTSLEALHSTLENINSLLIKHNLQTEQTSELFANITKFLVDIHAAEKRLHVVNKTIVRGGLRSARSRLEWSFSTRKWLQEFFEKIVMWHIIFSSELQAIQL